VRLSERDTSPERRAHSVLVDPTRVKLIQHKRFQSLVEERSHESGRSNDKVREGSVSDASNSRGSRMRDPVSLTPGIMAMLDRHEPDKDKPAKLRMEHLAGQRVLPSMENELHRHLERKAKREADRLTAASEAKAIMQEQITRTEETQKTKNATIVLTFA